jgi:hypothetical protein
MLMVRYWYSNYMIGGKTNINNKLANILTQDTTTGGSLFNNPVLANA